MGSQRVTKGISVAEESAVVASARRKLEALERDSSDHVAALESRWSKVQAEAKETAEAMTKRFEKLAAAVRDRAAEAAAGRGRREKQETYEFGGEEVVAHSQAEIEWEADVSSLAHGMAPVRRPADAAEAVGTEGDEPSGGAAAAAPQVPTVPRSFGRPRHRVAPDDDDEDDFSNQTWLR